MAISNEVPDTAIKIYGQHWVATILTSDPTPDGLYNVYCTTIGAAHEDAMLGATYVLNAFAFGRVAFIRAKPEANSKTDFDTKETRHMGFVRFSYRLEAGEWQYSSDEPVMVGFGDLQVSA